MSRAARATSTTGNAARRPARASATVTAALLTVGLFSACSGAETPQEDPSPNTTATAPPEEPTSSPSSEPSEPAVEKPERPAAMDKKNADGAAAAAGYFFRLDPYMMQSGDVREFKDLSFKTCDYCESRLDQAHQIKKHGDTYTGGETETTVTTRYARDEATGIWPFDVEIREKPSRIVNKSGKAVFTSEETKAERRVEIGVIDGDWVVVAVGSIPGN